MYRAIAKNKRNTVFILFFFLLVIGGLGWLASVIYRNWSIVVITVVVVASVQAEDVCEADSSGCLCSYDTDTLSTGSAVATGWRRAWEQSCAVGRGGAVLGALGTGAVCALQQSTRRGCS